MSSSGNGIDAMLAADDRTVKAIVSSDLVMSDGDYALGAKRAVNYVRGM